MTKHEQTTTICELNDSEIDCVSGGAGFWETVNNIRSADHTMLEWDHSFAVRLGNAMAELDRQKAGPK